MKYSPKPFVITIFIIGIVILLITFFSSTFTSEEKALVPTLTPQQGVLENQQGYQWAEDNNLTDVTQCEGKPKAFQQGCVNYIQDHIDDGLQDQDTAGE